MKKLLLTISLLSGIIIAIIAVKTSFIGNKVDTETGTKETSVRNEVPYSIAEVNMNNSNFSDIQKTLYGNWRKNYLKAYNNNEEIFTNSSDDENITQTVSEAQGYGMLITTIAGEHNVESAEKDYEDLYNYYIQQVDTKTKLMSWKQIISGDSVTEKLENNATDGDLYIAYSLIQAYKLWGTEKYKSTAETVLNNILEYNYNKELNIITLGSWVSKDSKEYSVFRSSDVIPMFFKEFGEFMGNSTWDVISESMLQYLSDVSNNSTSGLVSDMIVVENGKGKVPTDIVISSETDMQYSWSACRVPMQLAYDYNNEQAKLLVNNMMRFFETQPILYAGYNLDGTPTVDNSSIVFGGLLNYVLKKDSSFKNIDTGYDYYIDNINVVRGYYGDTLFLISNIMD